MCNTKSIIPSTSPSFRITTLFSSPHVVQNRPSLQSRQQAITSVWHPEPKGFGSDQDEHLRVVLQVAGYEQRVFDVVATMLVSNGYKRRAVLPSPGQNSLAPVSWTDTQSLNNVIEQFGSNE
jgi:hypothetical protein